MLRKYMQEVLVNMLRYFTFALHMIKNKKQKNKTIYTNTLHLIPFILRIPLIFTSPSAVLEQNTKGESGHTLPISEFIFLHSQ